MAPTLDAEGRGKRERDRETERERTRERERERGCCLARGKVGGVVKSALPSSHLTPVDQPTHHGSTVRRPSTNQPTNSRHTPLSPHTTIGVVAPRCPLPTPPTLARHQ